jgi:hypothetical protein
MTNNEIEVISNTEFFYKNITCFVIMVSVLCFIKNMNVIFCAWYLLDVLDVTPIMDSVARFLPRFFHFPSKQGIFFSYFSVSTFEI